MSHAKKIIYRSWISIKSHRNQVSTIDWETKIGLNYLKSRDMWPFSPSDLEISEANGLNVVINDKILCNTIAKLHATYSKRPIDAAANAYANGLLLHNLHQTISLLIDLNNEYQLESIPIIMLSIWSTKNYILFNTFFSFNMSFQF